ncbi:MAG: hypothetical protein LAP87_02965 [Acidobacteriia bacterium]|nr:hypothetical protein [Terriglobia bacterium]
MGAVAMPASGLPNNFTTGTTNGGNNGATTDRPAINGVVVGRNAGRGNAIYEISPFLERPFALGSERVHLVRRAESFNVFNHASFVRYSGASATAPQRVPGSGRRWRASPTSYRRVRYSSRPR